MIDLEKDFKLLTSLSSIRRYSRYYSVRPESVAEHTFHVLFHCMLILHEIKELGGDVDCHEGDYTSLYEGAILHDVEEVITGDIPLTTKHLNNEVFEALANAAEKSMKKLCQEYDLHEKFFYAWFSSGDGDAGRVVRVADLISVVQKSWEEITIFSNFNFCEVANGVGDYVDKLIVECDNLLNNLYRDVLLNKLGKVEEIVRKLKRICLNK